VIGPSEPGPQQYNAGGEIAIWTSIDRGKNWQRIQLVTSGSEFNHTYVRRPLNAHPDFYAMWADGHCRKMSQSHLYFCDKTGENVYRLPYTMEGDYAVPEHPTLRQRRQ